MAEELHNSVSEITEISVITGVGYFLAAIGWGTVAGTAAIVLWSTASVTSALDFAELLGFMLFLSFFVGTFTLAGMVAIGLPITIILRALKQEDAAHFAIIGAFAGCIAMAVIFEVNWILDPELVLLLVSGAIAGFACALRWGKWRERVANSRSEKAQKISSGRRSNPIHDLTH
ncbi:MAG: hypothetical protein AAF687_04300 [Pseudomonadota bacterium]